MKTLDLHGLIAAAYTPMRADGEVDAGVVPDYVDYLLSAGITAIFTCGTTGEYSSLTVAERKKVSEAFVSAVSGRAPVVVHVGHNCLPDACTLAAHAESIGAAAIAMCPPCYLLPADMHAVLDCCEKVAKAAPGTPFMYYHIPGLTRVFIDMHAFLAEAGPRVPSMTGVKYTFEDLDEYGKCVTAFAGRFTLLFGRDELMFSALRAGAQGLVGSTYNHIARHYYAIWEAFRKGDTDAAMEQQREAVRFADTINRHGGLSAGKACIRMLGVDVGPPRLPLTTLTPEMEQVLRQDLSQLSCVDVTE
jgi:N-acetylneuraminate lyase